MGSLVFDIADNLEGCSTSSMSVPVRALKGFDRLAMRRLRTVDRGTTVDNINPALPIVGNIAILPIV